MALTIVGVSIVTFAFIYLIPADPARALAGPHASASTIASIRHQLGLDRPIVVQYANYAWRALHGDFGYSFQSHQPVLEAIAARLPATAALAVAGIICELLIGLPVGLLAALRRGGWFDHVSGIILIAGVALPPFWIGLLLLYVFAYIIPIFPLSGEGPNALVLPAITLGIAGAAYYARLLRDSVSRILHEDYVRTARAKGCSTRRVIVRHVLRNAILAVVTMVGMDLGYFLGGVVLVEAVFGWPGIGLQAYQAISYLDIPMIDGTVFVAASAVVVANFLVDISYLVINPQVELMAA
jgi:peptide/nickel transport system permease protein